MHCGLTYTSLLSAPIPSGRDPESWFVSTYKAVKLVQLVMLSGIVPCNPVALSTRFRKAVRAPIELGIVPNSEHQEKSTVLVHSEQPNALC